ncbi:uncharacterized protein G2W53_006254 [Senna tora]|uniref:Uncharacterized protein n=1 Tax=Senna tora TaxID=362788 RepID=A0A834X3P7_9FABA|nr:uncharacterized protein G2W53_006254 [Senna tora]
MGHGLMGTHGTIPLKSQPS